MGPFHFLLFIQLRSIQAYSGLNSFPIPRDQLYETSRDNPSRECLNPVNQTKSAWEKCLNESPLTVDYTCRYPGYHAVYGCYCCGAFFHYLEQGPVCTKYCLSPPSQAQRFCQPRVIVLPFNWGDDLPDEITISNEYIDFKKSHMLPIPFESTSECPTDPFISDPEFGPIENNDLGDYWDPESPLNHDRLNPNRRPGSRKSTNPPTTKRSTIKNPTTKRSTTIRPSTEWSIISTLRSNSEQNLRRQNPRRQNERRQQTNPIKKSTSQVESFGPTVNLTATNTRSLQRTETTLRDTTRTPSTTRTTRRTTTTGHRSSQFDHKRVVETSTVESLENNLLIKTTQVSVESLKTDTSRKGSNLNASNQAEEDSTKPTWQ